MKHILKIGLFLFALTFVFTPHISFAAGGYVSDACPGSAPCPAYTPDGKGVGPFMQGISNTCGNTGKCELSDIMIVVENIGNFILSIIGSLLLLFYVYGGICYLVSHGDSKWIDKGKTAIKTSTTGFIIIMVAWLGIRTLVTAFTNKTPEQISGSDSYVTCSSDAKTDGQSCGLGKVCQGASCTEVCLAQHGKEGYQCKSVVDPSTDPGCLQESGLCGGTESYCCK